jgi:hypothetical protein
MIHSKLSASPVVMLSMCFLLIGFAEVSNGAVRFDVVTSQADVINTNLSDVTGSIDLIVRGSGNVTGTSTGGNAQIGITYNSNGTFMPVDNTAETGIVIFFSSRFQLANPNILSVVNLTIAGRCSGQITINLLPGATPADGDFIRVEGVRGRIAASSAATQGADLWASLQSINETAANTFTPDSVNIGQSWPGMLVGITPDNLLLCYPSLGKPPGSTVSYTIKITEGFATAFVDLAAKTITATTGGTSPDDRIDSGGGPLGAPNNSTCFTVYLDSIPTSVSAIDWSDSALRINTGGGISYLRLISSTSDGAGNASALYSYETTDQTNSSDITVETFTVQPIIYLNSNSTATGTVNAAVTLSPNGGSSSCQAPKNSSSDVQPRFSLVLMSDSIVANEVPGGGEPSKPYAIILECNAPPGKATLVSPSGTIATSTPTYTWNAVASATWYYLWVNDSSTDSGKIKTWYTSADAGCGSGTGTCSVAPSTSLAAGAAQWRVQTWNDAGYGPWSDAMSFTVWVSGPPGKATLVSPSGNISTTTPTYTWNAVPSATWYYLWVNDSSTNSGKIKTWYTSAEVGCGSGTGTCSVTPSTNLAAGAGQWWIQTWNNAGYGPWSDAMSFTVSVSGPPGRATLVSPSGIISTTTPTYTWNAVASATWYYLWVNDSTSTKMQIWYTAAQAGCGSGTGTCSVTPLVTLASGAAQWWIQTYNSAGYGPWSTGMSFTVP